VATLSQVDARPFAIDLDHVSILRAGKPTLDDVSFQVRRGEHWAVIGPNGAGKSTLLAVCATSTLPVRGTATILGRQVGKVALTEIRERLAYVTTHHRLEWPMTARDIVLTGFTNTIETPMRWQATPEQTAAADAQLAKFGLLASANTSWRALSQGELGRTLLARATLTKPELALFDEPAAGLDLAAREQVLDTLDELTADNPLMTSVMITHHLEELPSTTTHAALMRSGKIIESGLATEILTSANLTACFGVPIVVDFAHRRWSSRSGRVR
jgi:iron complex transport system ATP-binding protein